MLRVSIVAAALAAAASTVAAQPAAQPIAAPPAAPADPLAAFDAELGTVMAHPGGLTADAAAQRARAASPAAERKRAEVAGAQTSIDQIKFALLPRTTLSASYTRLSDVDAPMIAPGVSFPVILNSMHVGAEFAVPLTELFFRYPPATKAARAQVEATSLGGQAASLEAGAQAELLYYEWVRASLATLVAERQVAQVEANRAQLAVLVDVQRASRADLLQLEAAKAQAELALLQLNQASGVLADQLRVVMGADPAEPLTIGEDLRTALDLPGLPVDAELVQAALAKRLDAKAVNAAQAALDLHRTDAKTARLPRVNLFAQVNYDNPNQRIFPQSDQFNLTWAAGLQVTWNVNSYLSTTPDLRSIDAQRRALDADRRGLEMSISAQVASARSALAIAEAAFAASQRGLAAAAESYRVRQDLLASERATSTDLIAAETALTTARLTAINALIDRRVAWSRLRHAAGLDVP
ncbi:MAG: TolC family protein [Kofleriaceae bacterium]